MADTDIILSVDLDTKDALQTAKELGKEVEKSVNSQQGKELSPQMSSFNSQLKQTTIEAEKLGKQLEQVATKKIYTEEYTEIEKRLQKNNAQFDKLLIKQDEMQELGKTSGSAWETLNVKMEQLGTYIREDTAELNELVATGKAFTLGKDSEEYRKVENQLDKVNDKTKILLIRKKELQQKEAGGNGFQESLISMSASASKTLGIFKKFGKILKKGLLTVAAFTLGVRGIMGIIRRVRRMIIDGFKAITEGDEKLKKEVESIKNSWDEVKTNLVAAFMPIIEMAIPYVQKLLDWINLLLNKLSMFIAAIAGQEAYTKAIKKTGDAAKSASKQLSKFDELNNLSSESGADTGFDIQKLPIDENMLDMVAKLKEMLNELVATPFKEGFAEAIGDWKTKLDTIKNNIESIKSSVISIFADPEVAKSIEDYTKAYSKLLGSTTGLAANIGLNIAEAFTGGVDKFLKDNEAVIKTDISNMFDLDTENLGKAHEIVVSISKILDQIGESKSVVGAISNYLATVWNYLVSVKESASELMGMLLDTFGPAITKNVENFKATLESYFHNIETSLGFFKKVSETVKNTITGILKTVRPIFEIAGKNFSEFVAQVLKVYNTWLAPIFNEVNESLTELWEDYVDPIIEDIKEIITDLVTILTPILRSMWENVMKPIFDWLVDTIGPILVPAVSILINSVVTGLKLVFNIIKLVFSLIKNVVGFIADVATGDIEGAVGHLQGIFGSLIEFVVGNVKIAFEAIQKTVTNLIKIGDGLIEFENRFALTVVDIFTGIWEKIEDTGNKIIEFFKSLKGKGKEFWAGIISMAVDSINSLLQLVEDGINGLLTGLSDSKIANFLSDKFNLNIPTSFSIKKLTNVPGLAQGAVIPPSMGEFIARLGDNNRQTEIVSPLDTMKQAFLEAMKESGGFGGADIHVHVDIDGKEIAKAVVKQNDIYKKSTGRSLLAY